LKRLAVAVAKEIEIKKDEGSQQTPSSSTSTTTTTTSISEAEAEAVSAIVIVIDLRGNVGEYSICRRGYGRRRKTLFATPGTNESFRKSTRRAEPSDHLHQLTMVSRRKQSETDTTTPIYIYVYVVVVDKRTNERTASASEILTAALQDNQRACRRGFFKMKENLEIEPLERDGSKTSSHCLVLLRRRLIMVVVVVV